MEVMQTKKGPAWANDAPTVDNAKQGKQEAEKLPMKEDNTKPTDLSDLDWMKQRMSKNVDVVEKAFEQSDDEDNAKEPVRFPL